MIRDYLMRLRDKDELIFKKIEKLKDTEKNLIELKKNVPLPEDLNTISEISLINLELSSIRSKIRMEYDFLNILDYDKSFFQAIRFKMYRLFKIECKRKNMELKNVLNTDWTIGKYKCF